MRYYSSIVIKDGQAQYDCIVDISTYGSIDVSPFIFETPNTIALNGVVVITDLPESEFDVRESDESLESYASRLIEIETRHMMLHNPIGDRPKAFHCNYIIRPLQ